MGRWDDAGHDGGIDHTDILYLIDAAKQRQILKRSDLDPEMLATKLMNLLM